MSALTCPHCGVYLTQKERSGAACPTCGKAFDGGGTRYAEPAAPHAALPTGSGYYATATLPKRDLLGWGTIRAALALILIGMSMVLVFGLTLLLCGLAEMKLEGTFALMLIPSLAFGVGIGVVFCLTGTCMCCVTPADEARGWALGFVSCLLIACGVSAVYWAGGIQNKEALRRHELNRLEHEKRRIEENLRRRLDSKRPPQPPEPLPPAPVLEWSPTVLKTLTLVASGFLALGFLLLTLSFRGMAMHLQRTGLAWSFLGFALVFTACQITGHLFAIFPEKLQELAPADPNGRKIFLGVLIGIVLTFQSWNLTQICMLRGAITRGMLHREF